MKLNGRKHLRALLQILGINVTSLRESKGLSQVQLARLSKISTTTINEIERHHLRDMRLSTIVAISEVFGVPVTRLLATSDVGLTRRDRTRILRATQIITTILKRAQVEDTDPPQSR
jgi:transcriptional regulator with XRE-family HTH domain